MSSYDATPPRTPSWGSSRRTDGPGTAPRPSLGQRAGVAVAGEACHPCHLQAIFQKGPFLFFRYFYWFTLSP